MRRDGKPKPVDPTKIDPANPPKPQINIDTDDDGIPDTNVVDEPVITYTITRSEERRVGKECGS